MSFHFLIFPTSPAGKNDLNLIESYMGGGFDDNKIASPNTFLPEIGIAGTYYGDRFWDGNIWGAYPQYTR